MKTDPAAFSKSYQAALRKHLAQGPASSPALLSLGRRALKLGLETLELAKIHEEALVSLESTGATDVLSGQQLLRRGTSFFSEVITPIEETHQGAKEANEQMKLAYETLSLRTKELADSNEKLKGEIDQRKAAEASLRASEAVSSLRLKKSLRLQEELRLLSHRLLSIQEAMRKRLSRELHDVIAQALTGLDLQLVTLKNSPRRTQRIFTRKSK
ncbi:MAG: signal transduction histidine kinase [Verrucomicrobiales bacterium]|jgi:signal transduction histidine kinase